MLHSKVWELVDDNYLLKYYISQHYLQIDLSYCKSYWKQEPPEKYFDSDVYKKII